MGGGGPWPDCCWTHGVESCMMQPVTNKCHSLRGCCHPYPMDGPGGTAMLSWPCISWPWSSVCWIRAPLFMAEKLWACLHTLCVCVFASRHRWVYRSGVHCNNFGKCPTHPCSFAFSTAGKSGEGAMRTDVVRHFLSALRCCCIIHSVLYHCVPRHYSSCSLNSAKSCLSTRPGVAACHFWSEWV